MLKMEIKKKLEYFEKKLSVKYLARDIILLQVCILIGTLIAAFLFIGIVNMASNSSNPQQVMETAQTSSNNFFWFMYFITNALVMWVGSKNKQEAIKTKNEIIKNYVEVKKQ